MSDNNERTPQEYAYIMDGITVRMQTAIEKMAESNKLFRSTVKYVCIVMILVVLIMASGFIINNVIMINHVNSLRSSMAGEVVTYETVFQQRSGTGD